MSIRFIIVRSFQRKSLLRIFEKKKYKKVIYVSRQNSENERYLLKAKN